MKLSRPTPQTNLLYYSQQNQVQPKIIENSSISRPKLGSKQSVLISENLTELSLKDVKSKAKNLVIDYLKNTLKVQTFSAQVFNKIEAISSTVNIIDLFDLLFSIIAESIRQTAKKSQPKQGEVPENRERQLTFAIRSKQAKLLRLVKQETISQRTPKIKSLKKIQQCQRLNEDLKKELFTIKQEKLTLQKKIANLVQEFHNRKSFYLAEIKKLTQIVKMSSFDVRNLVMQRTKEAKKLHGKQQNNKKEPTSFLNVQSEMEIDRNHSRNLHSPKNHEKSTHQAIGSFNGYNTQIRMMKHVSSIQNYQEEKADSYITF